MNRYSRVLLLNDRYYVNEKSAAEIHKRNPGMKLLLIVREPVERMISHVIHMEAVRGDPKRNITWEDIEKKMFKDNKQTPTISKETSVTFSEYHK